MNERSGLLSPSPPLSRFIDPPWREGPACPPALARCLERLEAIRAGQELERRRQELPSTTCARQGDCCGLLPPLLPVEMLDWLAKLGSLPAPHRRKEARALVGHFLLNAAQRRACPWSRPGACVIYKQRFVACRAYGLWTPAQYEPRRRQAREAARQVVAAWQGLGIALPQAVKADPPPYCRQVRVTQGQRPHEDSLTRNGGGACLTWARSWTLRPRCSGAGET